MQEEKLGREAAEAARGHFKALLQAANGAQGSLQTRVDDLSSVVHVMFLLHTISPFAEPVCCCWHPSPQLQRKAL